jgi:hypothetical protein
MPCCRSWRARFRRFATAASPRAWAAASPGATLDGYDSDAGQLYRAPAKRNIPLGPARGSLSAAAAERIGETPAMKKDA